MAKVKNLSNQTSTSKTQVHSATEPFLWASILFEGTSGGTINGLTYAKDKGFEYPPLADGDAYQDEEIRVEGANFKFLICKAK